MKIKLQGSFDLSEQFYLIYKGNMFMLKLLKLHIKKSKNLLNMQNFFKVYVNDQ
jgi:hypothetical protein